jgi:hypothetical protein
MQMPEPKLDASAKKIDQLASKIGRHIFEHRLVDEGLGFFDGGDRTERNARYARVEQRLEQMRNESYQAGGALGAAVESALEIAQDYTTSREPLIPTTLVEKLSSQRRYNMEADPLLFRPITEAATTTLRGLPLRAVHEAKQIVRQSALSPSNQEVLQLVLELTEAYRRQHRTIPVEDIEGVSELCRSMIYCLDHASSEAAEPGFHEDVIKPLQQKIVNRFPSVDQAAMVSRAKRIRLHLHHLPDVETGWEFRLGFYQKRTGVIHFPINERNSATDSHEVLHALSLDHDSEPIEGLDLWSAKLMEEAIIETANGELGAQGSLSYPNERGHLQALLTWKHDLFHDIPQPGKEVAPLSLDNMVEMVFGHRDLHKLLAEHGYTTDDSRKFVKATNGLFYITKLQQDEGIKSGKHYSGIKTEWAEQFRKNLN